jgi:DNA repair exonuclease SbcCD nuclease subunit
MTLGRQLVKIYMPRNPLGPDQVIAIATSDLHVSLKCPLARQEEKDWKRAMNRVFLQIKSLAKAHKAIVIVAGDIFDKPIVTPETINWALDNLPTMYAVAGNHDLPTHRYDLEHRSAYGTLMRAGKIVELGSKPIGVDFMSLYGRPLGKKVPRKIPHATDGLGGFHVLVTHEYIWAGTHRYQGAPAERKLGTLARRFRNFDVVICGDNHDGFLRTLKSGTRVLNCGTPMRRKSSEIDYEPQVGLIWRSGKVTTHKLSTRRDLISTTVDPREEDREDEEVAEVVEGFGRLEPEALSFRSAMLRVLDHKKVARRIRDAVMEALDG